MNTIAIVRELADERSLTFFKLSQICDVSHSTLKTANAAADNYLSTQLSGSAMGWALPCQSSLRGKVNRKEGCRSI